MAVYQDTDFADFIEGTLSYFEKNKWVDLSHTNQDFVVTSRVFQGQKYGIDGGKDLSWKVQTSMNTSYTPIGVGATLAPVHTSHMDGASVPWAAAAVTNAWFVEEDDWQSSPEKIASILAMNENAMYSDMTVGMENDLWSSPTSSTQNPRIPMGIPFWVQKASTQTSATDFGFNGGDPSGFSSGAAGIDADTVTTWKNGNFGYSSISQSDAIPKLSAAMEKSHFKAPRAYPNLVNEKPQFVLYTTFRVWEAFQGLQTVSNDNLGNDVGKWRSTVNFKGVPMTWVPALSNSTSSVYDATNPIYGIDWNVLKLFFKKGWDWVNPLPYAFEIPDGQPTARRTYKYAWYNYRCMSRRQLFVGSSTVF